MFHAAEAVLQSFDVFCPFGWIPLLLYQCEYAFGLVVDAVGASWKLSVTFDFLLPTHVTSSSYPPPLRAFSAPRFRVRRRRHRVEHSCRDRRTISAAISPNVPVEVLTRLHRRRHREMEDVRHARGRYDASSPEVANSRWVGYCVVYKGLCRLSCSFRRCAFSVGFSAVLLCLKLRYG